LMRGVTSLAFFFKDCFKLTHALSAITDLHIVNTSCLSSSEIYNSSSIGT
jgi:hypothetical protein